MAKVDIKLQKTIISPKKANENFNTNFQEVSKSPEATLKVKFLSLGFTANSIPLPA